jgi:hypothetical protein
MIYSIEKNLQLAQELEVERGSNHLHTTPENGFKLGQQPTEDADMTPVESPLRLRILGVPSSIRNHERLGFTLSVFNDSEVDIFAIYFEGSNPEWQVSWADGGDELSCESRETALVRTFTYLELPHFQTNRVSRRNQTSQIWTSLAV